MNKEQEISDLLMQTGKAHHHAFAETDGADPEWPLWYSEYLQDRLPPILGKNLTRSRIIFELVWLGENADVKEEPWTKAYAKLLVQRHL